MQSPKSSIEGGNTIDTRAVQSVKVPYSKCVMVLDDGNTTLIRDEQHQNTPDPSVVTVDGIMIFVREVQFSNASSSIDSTVGSIMTVVTSSRVFGRPPQYTNTALSF